MSIFQDSMDDRLNDALDAWVVERSPTAESGDFRHAAKIHRLIAATADREPQLTLAESAATWRTVMRNVAAVHHPARPPRADRYRPARISAWASVLAAAALLVSIIGGAWMGRHDDPDRAPSRFAAMTAEASPTPAYEPQVSFLLPQPVACTVAPPSVDAMIYIISPGNVGEPPSASSPVPTPAQIDEDQYRELVSQFRKFLDCSVTLEDEASRWALQSDRLLRSQLVLAFGPDSTEADARAELEEWIRLAEAEGLPMEWDPIGRVALPMPADTFSPEAAWIDQAGTAHLRVWWVTRDGLPPEVIIPVPEQLNSTSGISEVLFVWDANRGEWLIDGFIREAAPVTPVASPAASPVAWRR